MSKLVKTLIAKGQLKSSVVIEAMNAVERIEFIPNKFYAAANADIVIPLGYGQIMPSPSTIASMLELLSVERDDHVLVVGFGRGWVTALVCHMVGPEGNVTSCDVSSSLEQIARENIEKNNYSVQSQKLKFVTVKTCQDIKDIGTFSKVVVISQAFAKCDFNAMVSNVGIIVKPTSKNIIQKTSYQADGTLKIETFDEVKFLSK